MTEPLPDRIASLAPTPEPLSDAKLAARLAALRGSRNSFMAVKKARTPKKAKAAPTPETPDEKDPTSPAEH
jgi:hypothetical protein